MITEEYNRLVRIYNQVTAAGSPLDALSVALLINNESATVASGYAKGIFNIKAKDKFRSSRWSESTQSAFFDESERKAKDTIIGVLNNFIRKLESFRWGYNKISALLIFMMNKGLYGIINELYVPEQLRSKLDSCIKYLEGSTQEILDETIKYFSSKGDPGLTNGMPSIGRVVLTEIPSRATLIMRSYCSDEKVITEEDVEYLRSQRARFRQFLDDPDQEFLKAAFEMSEGSYRRQINAVMESLVEHLDGDTRKLLADILLKS